jgi:TonB-dependent starch-binding outer membrane protein SusC
MKKWKFFRNSRKGILSLRLLSPCVLIITLLLTGAFLCVTSQPVHAQAKKKLNGIVKDGDGNPLKGVTINLKGTATTVMTDEDGKFTINVMDAKSLLVISSVTYETVERMVGNTALLEVVMRQTTSSMDDVVVIGYGTAKKKDVITSISKAPIEDMKKAPVPSFDQMLAGRVAGVNVVSLDGQPGAAANISIRGSSVSQETSPLFVIDGFPVENMDINSINPNDIESLEILKDPSSVAIYGSRGANGVILITTKRGKSGPPRVTYGFSFGFQKDVNRVKMMDPYEFVKLQLELDSIASTPAVPSTRFRQIYLDPSKGIDLEYYRTQPGYDWQDLLLQTGSIATQSLNISGGNSNTRYSVSGNFFNQKGIIINTGLKRYDGRFSLDQMLSKNLKAGVNASYSNSTSFGTIAATGATGGVVQGMWQYRPTTGATNQDVANDLIDSTNLQDFFNGTISNLGDNLVNPLLQAENEYRKTISKTTFASAYLEFSFARKFKLRLSGGINSTDLTLEQFFNSNTQQGNLLKNAAGAVPNVNGINGAVQNSLATTYSTTNTLTYNTKFKKDHSLDALAGFEYQYGEQRGTRFAAINVPQATEYLGIISLGTGTPSAANFPSGTHNQSYSLFGRVNYNYKGKYYLMAAMRMDGSSRFAPGKQWGYFPSAGAAWTFSEEKFWAGLKDVISYARLRYSYGNTGNNRVGDFSYLSQYGSLTPTTGYAWNNVNQLGITPFFYGNNQLTWETTSGSDFGLNLEFFKKRITVEAVYYIKNTKNFLLGVRLPNSAGYPNGANTQYQNVGRLSNSGFEFTLSTLNVVKKDFSWSTDFNISFNKSEVKEFYNGLESIQTGWSLTGNATAWLTKVGGPISQFYGYRWGGVYQYADFERLANGTYALRAGIPTYSSAVQPGDPKYQDINGDGVVDANDQTTLGSPLPLHVGGLNNNFTYKNWSFNIFFQWSYGNEILNANRIVFESNGGYSLNYNQLASYAGRWTPNNPTNDIPRARFNLKGDAGSPNPRPSSRVIEDGSFIRLKTMSIGYNLSADFLRSIKINSVRLFASAQNLVTWTKYSGVDPEVSTFRANNPANSPFGGSNVGGSAVGGAGYTFIQPSSGYSALAGGYDYTPYPRAMTVTFGANIIF